VTKKILSLADVIALAEEQVTKKGADFKYASVKSEEERVACYYVPMPGVGDKGDPRRTTGCLVGEVLRAAGEKKFFTDYDALSEIFNAAYPYGEVIFTEDAGIFLAIVQGEQDAGVPWSSAVRQARNRINKFI
jgi:hypothetical protein